MQLLEGGQSLVVVAWMVGAAISAVWQWRASFRRAGADGLAAKPAPGRPPKLSPQQRQRLPKLLAVGARHYGYPNELWTTRRIAAVIQQELQVNYHPAQVSRILRDLDWSYQKPERRAVERNQAAIDHWKRYHWVAIKK
ncbi:MAG: transposase, partial [Deltaproteobacteria bacterium]|nr:transposase [Deltaproteobacteria bacterium]